MQTLYNQLETIFKTNPTHIFFDIKRGLRRQRYSGLTIIEQVNSFSNYLSSQGFKPGDSYLLWGPNCPEWVIAYIAGIRNGLCSIPVDVRSNWSTAEAYILKTKPKFAIVSRFLLPFFKSELPVFVLEDITSFTTNTICKPQPTDPVEIVFTSGSSGTPKGVMITQENVLSQMDQVMDLLPNLSKFETVSILPLSHMYEQMYGLFLPVFAVGTVHYLPRVNPLTIKKELKRSSATYLLAVPQMLRVMYENILRNARSQGKDKLFSKLISIAGLLPKPVQRRLFHRVHEQFGGMLDVITTGSAPLEPKLAKYWENMGFRILEGYGASETSGMVTILPWRNRKFGTVGKTSKLAQVKLDTDGQILAKGPIVSPGYYEEVAKTKASFRDGWYYTGDVGSFDKDGFLTITGRISSRIILSDGTKVYPEDIERMLNDQSEILDSCIVEVSNGDHISIHAWVLGRDLNYSQLSQIIKRVNQKLESKQQISSFEVWSQADFPRLRSRKVDRQAVRGFTSNKQLSHDHQDIHANTNDLYSILEALSGKKKVVKSMTLGSDLGLDSLRRINLAAIVEQQIGVELHEFGITAQTTVAQLEEMLHSTPPHESKHTTEVILHHWRFNHLATKIRPLIQQLFMFPWHTHFVKLKLDSTQKHLLSQVSQPTLILVNHPGMFDMVSILRLIPYGLRSRLAIPVTEERWEDGNKSISTLIDLFLGGFPIGQKGAWMGAGLEAIGELVDQGYSVLLAPEGKMQREGKQNPFMPGLGYLIKELSIPVLMCKISAAQYRSIWPAPAPGKYATDSSYYFPQNPGTVEVRCAYATIDPNFGSDELTKSVEKQFTSL
jgi:long-chain acyl-CoA synthetase